MPTPVLIPSAPAYILTPAGASAGQLDQAFAAADVSNGNYFVSSGKDMLVVWNDSAGTLTFGIASASDQFGRKADITAYSILAHHFAVVVITSQSIYTQANGQVLLTASDPAIKYMVLSGS